MKKLIHLISISVATNCKKIKRERDKETKRQRRRERERAFEKKVACFLFVVSGCCKMFEISMQYGNGTIK
jgi:hypothetical protein